MKIPADQGHQAVNPHEGFQGAGVPAQNIDIKIGIFFEQPVEIVAYSQGAVRLLRSVMHFHPLVKIPAQQHDPLLCLGKRLPHCAKIIFTIYQNRRSVCMLDAPAIFPGLEYVRHKRSTFPV